MHKVNVSIPKYRSQSTQFKLFRSISARSHSQRKFKVIVDKTNTFVSFVSIDSIFIRISEFFRRIYGGKNSAADTASRILFYSPDIRRTKIRRSIQIFGGGLGSTCV